MSGEHTKLTVRYHDQINYLLVGCWNTIFSYLAFAALYFLLRGYLHYMVLFVISSILGITNAYVAYKLFVFRTKGHYLREYSRFYLVYGGALALNLVLLPLVVITLRLSPVVAQAGLAVITVLFSYFGHKNFSFKAAVLLVLGLGASLALASASAGDEINLMDQAYTWTPIGPQISVKLTDGVLKIAADRGPVGVFNQKMAGALLEENSLLTFELKTSAGKIGTVFWSNYLDQRFMPQRSFQFYLGRSNTWRRYYIDLNSHEKELTRIDYVLLNPLVGSGEAQVRGLKIVKATATEKLLAGWQEFLGVKGREVVGYTINTMPSPMLFGREIFIYIYWLVALASVVLLALELWPAWRQPEKPKAKGKEKKGTAPPVWSKYEPAFNRAVKKIVILVIALWAALELSSLYTDWLNLRSDLPLVGQGLEQKRTLVNTGDFYPFIRFCEEKLPAGAAFDMRIPPLYNDAKAIYYLIPHANVKDADYLIVYDQEVEPAVRRAYEPFAVFRTNALIMKKVKS